MNDTERLRLEREIEELWQERFKMIAIINGFIEVSCKYLNVPETRALKQAWYEIRSGQKN